MATTRNRRTARTKSIVGVQKQINTDYEYLIRDYAKLGAALMRRPLTRFILGGVALTVISPYILRMFRSDEVQTFVRDNVEGIRSRVDGFMHSSDSDLETLNQ